MMIFQIMTMTVWFGLFNGLGNNNIESKFKMTAYGVHTIVKKEYDSLTQAMI